MFLFQCLYSLEEKSCTGVFLFSPGHCCHGVSQEFDFGVYCVDHMAKMYQSKDCNVNFKFNIGDDLILV